MYQDMLHAVASTHPTVADWPAAVNGQIHTLHTLCYVEKSKGRGICNDAGADLCADVLCRDICRIVMP